MLPYAAGPCGRLVPVSEPVEQGPRAAEAMVTRPKVLGPDATVGDVRAQLGPHVHVSLVVDGAGLLLAVVDRDDVAGVADDVPAREVGELRGRTVAPDADAAALRQRLGPRGLRRVAVVDDGGRLLGLMCLKRTGTGFCTDAGVAERRTSEP